MSHIKNILDRIILCTAVFLVSSAQFVCGAQPGRMRSNYRPIGTARVRRYLESNRVFEDAAIKNKFTEKVFPIDPFIRFWNPYQNYKYYYKGQLHAHSKRSDGTELLKPKLVLMLYGLHGYNFVSLTDYDDKVKCWQIFKDPGVAGVTYIPGEEGGKGHRTHFVEVNLTKNNPCRPPGDFDLQKRIGWVESGGGFTAAAHPLHTRHLWKDDELFNTLWLHGLEVHDQYNDGDGRELWDRLLRIDRVRWGIATDDFHEATSIGRGYVMVNSNLDYVDRHDVTHNLRNGNFYSVFGKHNVPRFHKITTQVLPPGALSGQIKITFSGAETVKVIDRRGTKCYTGHDESGFPQVNTVTHTVDGSEGFVRIELHHTGGYYALSQPIFVYGNSVGFGRDVDYQNARVEEFPSLNLWRVVDDAQPHGVFRTKAAAEQALGVLKHYKIDRVYYIGSYGRPKMNMMYFTTGGKAPSGPYPGENSIDITPSALDIKLVENPDYAYNLPTWKLMHGNECLFDFDDSKIQALRAREIIRRYGFTKLCVIDGPLVDSVGITYFRK